MAKITPTGKKLDIQSSDALTQGQPPLSAQPGNQQFDGHATKTQATSKAQSARLKKKGVSDSDAQEHELDQDAAQAGALGDEVVTDSHASAGDSGVYSGADRVVDLDGMQLAQADTGTTGMGQVQSGAATSVNAAAPAGAATINPLVLGAIAVGAGAILSSSGSSDSGSSGSDSGTPDPHVVSGTFTAGPTVTGHKLTVKLYDAKGNALKTADGQAAEAVLDASGKFSIDVGSYTGKVLVQLVDKGDGVDYLDEATGKAVDLTGDLLALGTVGAGATTININPLTTLAANVAGVKVSNGALDVTAYSEAKAATANTDVAKAFGLTGDVTKLDPTPIIQADGSANTGASDLGKVLAALSGLDSKNGGLNATLGSMLDTSGGLKSSTEIQKAIVEGAKAVKVTGVELVNDIATIVSKSTSTAGYAIETIETNDIVDPAEKAAWSAASKFTFKVPAGTNAADLKVVFNGGAQGDGQFVVNGTTAVYTIGTADLGVLRGLVDGVHQVELKAKGVVVATRLFSLEVAPTGLTLVNQVNSMDENTPNTEGKKVADIVPKGGATPALADFAVDNGAKFEIKEPTPGKFELWLKAGVSLDHEAAQSLSTTVTLGSKLVQTYKLAIANVNEAPTAANTTVYSTEDTPYGFKITDFGFADSADGSAAHSLLNIIVSELPKLGTLKLNGAAVTVNQVISSEDIQAGHFTFQSAANGNGSAYTTMGFKVQDNGGTANGGSDTSIQAYTLTLNVTPTNDAPELNQALKNQIFIIDELGSFELPDSAFVDVDNSSLTYTATLADGSALPVWLKFNAETRTFQGTPTSPSPITVRVKASDGELFAQSDFQIKVASTSAPMLSLEADTGSDKNDGLTKNPTVLVSGLVENEAWEYSTDNGVNWVAGTGNSFKLASGKYESGTVQVKQASSSAKNITGALNLTVEVDTSAPVSSIKGFDKEGNNEDGIVDTSLTDIVGTGMTSMLSFGLQPSSALLEGTSEAFATVTITLGGQDRTATANSAGYWSYRLTEEDFANVGYGAETITVKGATDLAGNTSTDSVKRDVTFNAVADTRSHEANYGSDYVDALVYEGAGWQGKVITYSFKPGEGKAEWTAEEKQAFAQACQVYANVCNLQLVEGTYYDDNDLATSIVVSKEPSSTWDEASVMADFNLPTQGINSFYGPVAGRFDYEEDAWQNLQAGSLGFYVLVHELGHGLGLAHPFDDDPKFPGVTSTLDKGQHNLNQGIWTVMSYDFDWDKSPANVSGRTSDWGHAKTPMTFDVAALQAVYGANMRYRTGNDTYSLPTSEINGTGWECIWDAGGTDTISNEGATSGCFINLNAYPKKGGVVSEGYVSYNYAPAGGTSNIAGGFTIADGAVIENAIGGNGDDTLTGNQVSNTLTGHDGADKFVFNTTLDGSNVDTITDFNQMQLDKIVLDKEIFQAFANASGVDASQLHFGAGLESAADANDYLVYNTTTGALYYDADGSASASSAVLFAVLSNKASLSAAQIMFA